MATRKDGSNQNLDERNSAFSSDKERADDESDLDIREISNDIEEEENHDDDELTEEDFEVDEDENEEEDEEVI